MVLVIRCSAHEEATVNSRRFAELLDQIYEAALDPVAWPIALETLSNLLSSDIFTLYFQDNGAAYSQQVVGMERSSIAAYDQYYCKMNPFPAAAARRPDGEISVGHECVDMNAMERGEFYNDFMRPQGLHDCIGFIVQRESSAVLAIAGSRLKRAGLYTEADKTLMRQISPHIRRAVSIHRRLSVAEGLRGGLVVALDRLGVGALLIGGDGRVLYANRAAEAALQRGDVLVCQHGCLRAATSHGSEDLDRQIRAVVSTGSRRGHESGGVVTLPTTTGQFATILVCPCRGTMRLGHSDPAAMVFVGDSQAPVAPDEPHLARRYGLTRAEVRLAGALLEGKRLSQYADKAGITRNTAKGYLKQLFNKTGTDRQADLVRLILSDQLLRLAASGRQGSAG
jgi:DNA-binding CsgD family transcriptional regulator/PAS domain-containing protein